MTTRTLRAALTGFALAASFSFHAGSHAQTTGNGEWPSYGGDLAHTRYAPFDQINASNFGSLEVAWRFSTVNLGPTPEYRFQSTPVMVDGVLYTTGGSRRAVTALDAATGEQLWVYSLNEGERGAERGAAVVGSRARVLEQGPRQARAVRDAGLSTRRAECRNRPPGRELRQARRRRSLRDARSGRRLGQAPDRSALAADDRERCRDRRRRAHAARAGEPGQAT